MKVEEARNKICPFMEPNYNKTYFGNINDPYACRCITDKCMAWEWNDEACNSDDTGWTKTKKSTTDGYCKRIGQ